MWGGGTVPPKTMNVAGFYLLLLAVFMKQCSECMVPVSRSVSYADSAGVRM